MKTAVQRPAPDRGRSRYRFNRQARFISTAAETDYMCPLNFVFGHVRRVP